ncbi:MAG: protein TolQ [Proteobacteria bacterium]|nr:protein TolQ [Pseudomonadota bacterium]
MDITTIMLKSDIMIKAVMLFLLFFSVVSWAVFLSKYFYIKKINQESDEFYNKFLKTKDMDQAFTDAQSYPEGFIPALYSAGYNELKELCNNVLEKESLENVQRSMEAKKEEILKDLGSKVTFLATVGASSPFIGLLGTVWGIINAFRGLAIQQNNTLSAVAPGIAEALITTAVGLLTAIPAVIFYNHISHKLEKIEQRSNSFMLEFVNITYKTFLQPERAAAAKGDKKNNANKKNIQENVQ